MKMQMEVEWNEMNDECVTSRWRCEGCRFLCSVRVLWIEYALRFLLFWALVWGIHKTRSSCVPVCYEETLDGAEGLL